MGSPLSEPIESDPLPQLVTTGLPERERHATFSLVRLLHNLDEYTQQFHAALNLFDFALSQVLNPEQRHVRQWLFIACRDGAMTIFHFGQTLKYVKAALGSCRTVNSLVDSQSLRLVSKKFDARFPDIESLRNAGAHASELWKNITSLTRNALAGRLNEPFITATEVEDVIIQGNLSNRQFSMTIEKQLVSYEISTETLFNLISLKNEVMFTAKPTILFHQSRFHYVYVVTFHKIRRRSEACGVNRIAEEL